MILSIWTPFMLDDSAFFCHKPKGSIPYQQRWKMMESSFRGNFSGWSTTFDSLFLPPALSWPNGKSDRMVSWIMVTIVRASWQDKSWLSTHHLVACDAKLTMTKSHSVGACVLLSVHLPSLSPLLVCSLHASILVCIIVVWEKCANQSLFLNYCAAVGTDSLVGSNWVELLPVVWSWLEFLLHR
jgi:hypothetical protein